MLLGLGVGDLKTRMDSLVLAGTVRSQMGVVHRWDCRKLDNALRSSRSVADLQIDTGVVERMY